MGPDEKTYQSAIDSRRSGSIVYHHSHLDPRALQTRVDRQDHQMLLSITCGVSRLPFIGLGTQIQGKAHLVERQADPVGMNLDARDEGEEKRAKVLRTRSCQRAASRAASSTAMAIWPLLRRIYLRPLMSCWINFRCYQIGRFTAFKMRCIA